jgi:two-component system response regulator AtoC
MLRPATHVAAMSTHIDRGTDSRPQGVARSDVITRRIDTRDHPVVVRPLGTRHQLLVWLGETVQPWPLPELGEAIVGRAADTDIRIEFSSVSRRHARLHIDAGSVRIVDLGSQNGTRVNGERLMAPRALTYGDILTFGEVTAAFSENHATSIPPQSSPAATLPANQTVNIGDRMVLVTDPGMAHVYTQVARLAPTDLSVLILGETGVGKELAASALRAWSKRACNPMVTINCAALPEGLAESELFGYERGAFSGADGAKPGLLEAAHGGTVLFDEIGDLPLRIQAKLLRVIENGRVTRLGSVRERAIDVRIIGATNRDLDAGVKEGWFRADLFYRLGVAVVHIPPLRARRRELPLLARRFVAEACRTLGRAPLTLEDGAIAGLLAHDWPGNVRELKNLIDCMVVAATGTALTAQIIANRLDHGGSLMSQWTSLRPDVGEPVRDSGETGPVLALAEATRQFERKTIQAALTDTAGNKTHAAKRLGVPLRTFMDKIRRYRL